MSARWRPNAACPAAPRSRKASTRPSITSRQPFAASIGDPLDYQFLRANPDVSIEPVPNWSPNFFIHTTLEDWPWRDGPLAFHMARLWSVLLSTLTVLATYCLVRTGFPDWPGLALVAAGVLALLPEFAFIGGSVNNDNGAALMGAVTLWGALALYQSGGRRRAVWWTALAMGLGLLVKISTLALWPVALAAAVLGAARGGAESGGLASWARSISQSWRQWVGTCLLLLGIALGAAAPWLIRNWTLYGDPLGQGLTKQTIDLRADPWTAADTVWLLRGWFQSFWGKFGGAGHIPLPSWVYWTLGAVSLLAIAGLVRGWVRFPVKYRPVVLLLLLATVSVAVGIWRYSLIALGTNQGRLLYPAVSAIVALFVLGLAAWTPERWRTAAATAGLAALTVLSVFGLAGVIRPAFAPPPTVELTRISAELLEDPVHFGPLTLIGWQSSADPVLYWRAPQQPDEDWRTTLRIVAEDGSLVWEWRRSPGYGRWSTDHWPAGALLSDRYVIDWPEWAGPGRYRVEVGAQPHGGEPAVPASDGAPIASPENPHYFLGWIERS